MTSSMYYQLGCDHQSMTAFLEAKRRTSKPLVRGIPVTPPPSKLPFIYEYRDPTGSELYDFYSGPNIMSQRLIDALEATGVDNLQKFDLELVDANTGKVRRDYRSVNIIGLVACADVTNSATSELGDGYYFHNLVIHESKTQGLLIFRLAESLMDVIVHEKVARAIEAGNFRGIILTPATPSPTN